MDPQQAQDLGSYMRSARTAAGLSAAKLAEQAGMHEASVLRIEHGQFEFPAMEKLIRLAEALELDYRHILRLANYYVPELPALPYYLRERFSHLPEEATQSIERYAVRTARKYGLQLDGTNSEELT